MTTTHDAEPCMRCGSTVFYLDNHHRCPVCRFWAARQEEPCNDPADPSDPGPSPRPHASSPDSTSGAHGPRLYQPTITLAPSPNGSTSGSGGPHD